MRKLPVGIKLNLVIIFAILALLAFTPCCNAATEEEINQTIADGLSWLVEQQKEEGYFGNSSDYSYYKIGQTGLAILTFEEYAKRLGYSPFDPNYMYMENVERGIAYILKQTSVDENGVYFSIQKSTYLTSISMMVLASSNSPERVVNVTGSAVDGWMYEEVVHGMADWLTYSQQVNLNYSCDEGGWDYADDPTDIRGYADQILTGYATMGMSYASVSPPEGFGIQIPAEVWDRLGVYVSRIQDPVDGDDYDGGSWYEVCEPIRMVNILKTGFLLYEMAFVGGEEDRMQNAINYIATNWNTTGLQPEFPVTSIGWRDSYHAMFTMMSGFESLQIDKITVNGSEVDWYEEVSDVIVSNQLEDGSFAHINPEIGEGEQSAVLRAVWALLTLQKVSRVPETSQEFKISNLTYTTGNFYINWTWDFDANHTEIYINGSLQEQYYTLNHYNLSLSPHACKEISIRPVLTDNTTIYGNFTNQTACIPNNPITITNTSDWNGVEGETVYLDLNFTDLDNDTPSFSTNASKGELNITTGVFIWKTGNDSGTYVWIFNVSDGYGSEDSYTATIVVGDSTPLISLTNTTGNFFVNWTWESINADSFRIFNGSWFNTTQSYWNESLSPHATANITVCAYNATLQEEACMSDSVQLENNIPVLLPLSDVTAIEGDTVSIHAEAFDADNDTLSYYCNRTEFDFNATTGEGIWNTTLGDAGIYVIEMGVSDGYGGVDNQTCIINVSQSLPEILFSEDNIDFGEVHIGDSATRTLSVSNIGNVNLTIYEINISDMVNFAIHENCTAYGVIPGENCSVKITFRPDSEGEKNATLAIKSSASNLPEAIVVLKGNGTLPGFTCGDTNCDNRINMGDVILLLNNVTFAFPLCSEYAGNVKCDDRINMGDVILLLNNVTYGTPLNCCYS